MPPVDASNYRLECCCINLYKSSKINVIEIVKSELGLLSIERKESSGEQRVEGRASGEWSGLRGGGTERTGVF